MWTRSSRDSDVRDWMDRLDELAGRRATTPATTARSGSRSHREGSRERRRSSPNARAWTGAPLRRRPRPPGDCAPPCAPLHVARQRHAAGGSRRQKGATGAACSTHRMGRPPALRASACPLPDHPRRCCCSPRSWPVLVEATGSPRHSRRRSARRAGGRKRSRSHVQGVFRSSWVLVGVQQAASRLRGAWARVPRWSRRPPPCTRRPDDGQMMEDAGSVAARGSAPLQISTSSHRAVLTTQDSPRR
jgi:hypothetical protein